MNALNTNVEGKGGGKEVVSDTRMLKNRKAAGINGVTGQLLKGMVYKLCFIVSFFKSSPS